MNLGDFKPDERNYCYLKENTFNALKGSIAYLNDLRFFHHNLHSLLDQVLGYLEHSSNILYPFTLLNYALTSAYERGDRDSYLSLVESFDPVLSKIGSNKEVIAYGDPVLSDQLWDLCSRVISSSFSQQITLTAPAAKDLEHFRNRLNSALDEIKEINQACYREIEHFISAFMVVKSDRFIAGSSFPLIDLIGLSYTLSDQELVEYIVHECAHLYIYHLTVFDELCSGEGLYKSPLRSDPRPIEGIYHATFVLARTIYYYQSYTADTNSHKLEDVFVAVDNFKTQFYDGYSVIKESATLTPLGQSLINSCKTYVDKC